MMTGKEEKLDDKSYSIISKRIPIDFKESCESTPDLKVRFVEKNGSCFEKGEEE